MRKNIILVGFMGVGKTTLGKKMAHKLNYHFIDTDHIIESKENLSVNEIFQSRGEDYFRQLEDDLISHLPKENTVIATGGGLPCRDNNLQRLNGLGVTIYLKRPSKELFARLNQSKDKRPLIANLTDDQLEHFIEEKLEEREVFYNQCHIIADRDNQFPDVIISFVENFMNNMK
jgi:shikimate kinase